MQAKTTLRRLTISWLKNITLTKILTLEPKTNSLKSTSTIYNYPVLIRHYLMNKNDKCMIKLEPQAMHKISPGSTLIHLVNLEVDLEVLILREGFKTSSRIYSVKEVKATQENKQWC